MPKTTKRTRKTPKKTKRLWVATVKTESTFPPEGLFTKERAKRLLSKRIARGRERRKKAA